MTALPTGRRGQMLALGLTALVLAALWLGAIQPLGAWFLQRGENLTERQALAQRMARLAATLPTLRQQQAAVAPDAGPAVLLQGETDAVAAAALQERAQSLAAAAGATISSVEMLPPEAAPAGTNAGASTGTSTAAHAIRLRLSLEATWPVLLHLLDAVAAGPPLMLVEDLQLEGTRLVVRPTVAPLQARITVTGFRAAAGR